MKPRGFSAKAKHRRAHVAKPVMRTLHTIKKVGIGRSNLGLFL
jgi:hypothetical protein